VLGLAAGSTALGACSGSGTGTGTVKVEGTSVDAPAVASIKGTVFDGAGWTVQIVVTSGARRFTTTATDAGDYVLRDVPVGTATVQWTATTRGSASTDASVGNARRDGSLEVDHTAGTNQVDIQL